MMDTVFLSRIQFALSVGFHFIFPSLTLGLTFIISVFETIFYKSGDEKFKDLSAFLIKILGLIFTLGVATGIVMEFSFGTNWAQYSVIVGDIFGAPLAIEAVFAFFLESVFIGVLLFGRSRVSKRTFLISAYIVAFASHLSAFWIIVANSWMQTPAGFVMENGRASLTSFFDAVFNPSTLIRFVHTVLSSWVASSAFTAGIGAYYLLKNKFREISGTLVKFSLIIFIVSSLLMLVTGHAHSVQVAKTQPVKMAAFEALWKTQTRAPMSIIGIPDADKQETKFEIAIPGLLSLLVNFDLNSEIRGLDAFEKNVHPPILLPYFSYHVMVGLGMIFIAMAFGYGFLLYTGRVYSNKLFQLILLLAIPLPHFAIQLGWMAAETGRQPWVVYNVLLTENAASAGIPAGQVLFTLILFSVIYLLLFILFITVLKKFIQTGPEPVKA